MTHRIKTAAGWSSVALLAACGDLGSTVAVDTVAGAAEEEAHVRSSCQVSPNPAALGTTVQVTAGGLRAGRRYTLVVDIAGARAAIEVVADAAGDARAAHTPAGAGRGTVGVYATRGSPIASCGLEVVAPTTCPDGACGADEGCASCPQDCGDCPPQCGDHVCDAAESCEQCPADCGSCPPPPAACAQGSVVQAHRRRVGANLLSDPSITDPRLWSLRGSATLDSAVTRGTGGLSGRLVTLSGDWIASQTIPVTPGKTYAFALYVRSDVWPTLAYQFVARFRSDGTHIADSGDGNVGSVVGNSAANVWEENVLVYQAGANDSFVRLYAQRFAGPRNDGTIWVDDFYFGETIGFAEAPEPKQEFAGATVRVDSLGNYEVRRDGQWTPYFPLCIYADGARADWGVYSRQGFNCNMWAASAGGVLKAKNAVSAFNPQGMMSGFQVAGYAGNTGTTHPSYNQLETLAAHIRDIHAQGLSASLLMFYWDNENAFTEWDVPNAVIDTIRSVDVDAGGRRHRPVYALMGNEGSARVYRDMVEVVGDYVAGGTGSYWGGRHGLAVMNNVQGQRHPAAIGQLNEVTDGADLRVRVFETLIEGGRGIGLYRDWYTSKRVENQAWWTALPQLRRDLDAMMPLIRTPHWTDWRVTESSGRLLVGTRDLDCRGHLLVANPTGSALTVTFRFEGLPYAPSAVVDYLDGAQLAPVSGQAFTLGVPAGATLALRLEL